MQSWLLQIFTAANLRLSATADPGRTVCADGDRPSTLFDTEPVCRAAGSAGTQSARRHHEAEPAEVQLIDKDVDHPRRIVLAHVVIKTARQQRRLSAVFTLNEAAHLSASDIVMSGVCTASRFYTASSHQRTWEGLLVDQ